MNQKLYFATGKACFLQIKLKNLHLFIKMLNIWKYEQMLELQEWPNSCRMCRCYLKAAEMSFSYWEVESGKSSIFVCKTWFIFLFINQALPKLKRKDYYLQNLNEYMLWSHSYEFEWIVSFWKKKYNLNKISIDIKSVKVARPLWTGSSMIFLQNPPKIFFRNFEMEMQTQVTTGPE